MENNERIIKLYDKEKNEYYIYTMSDKEYEEYINMMNIFIYKCVKIFAKEISKHNIR